MRRRSASTPLACLMVTRLPRACWELGGEQFGLVEGAQGQNADGGHVREGLAGADIVLAERAGARAEQVERPDDRGAQAQGKRVHADESGAGMNPSN